MVPASALALLAATAMTAAAQSQFTFAADRLGPSAESFHRQHFYPKHGLALQVTEPLQKTPQTLGKVDIPQELGPEEVLIEVVAAAQNPVDAKTLDRGGISSFPWTLGGDVAGKVIAVGSDVHSVKHGDSVAAFLNRKTARNGGYQQYAVGQAPQLFKIPSYLSYEEASTIPLAFATAVGGVFKDLGIPIPPAGSKLPLPHNDLPPVLVWGGSSSVGAYAIQLAALSGFDVIATASPANFDYVRSLGAGTVIDHHDGEKAVEEIKAASRGKLSLVSDAISENGSTAFAARAIGPDGGKIALVLGVDESVLAGRKDIQLLTSGAKVVYQDPAILDAYRFIAEALEQKVFKPNPVEIIPGGLLGVNEGFNRQRTQTISGVKLVYKVFDTPGLKHQHGNE